MNKRIVNNGNERYTREKTKVEQNEAAIRKRLLVVFLSRLSPSIAHASYTHTHIRVYIHISIARHFPPLTLIIVCLAPFHPFFAATHTPFACIVESIEGEFGSDNRRRVLEQPDATCSERRISLAHANSLSRLPPDSGFVVLQGTTYWTDLFVRHFLFQAEHTIDGDDLLFFVRKKHVKTSSRYLPKFETEVDVFRKDSKKLPIGDPDIDWEETVYLNLVVHQFDYTLTLAICTRTSPKELQVSTYRVPQQPYLRADSQIRRTPRIRCRRCVTMPLKITHNRRFCSRM